MPINENRHILFYLHCINKKITHTNVEISGSLYQSGALVVRYVLLRSNRYLSSSVLLDGYLTTDGRGDENYLPNSLMCKPLLCLHVRPT